MEFQDLSPLQAVKNTCEMEEINGSIEKEVEHLTLNLFSKLDEIDNAIRSFDRRSN